MQPGRRIQQYVLIEQIGQGGQAAVWSAEDEQLRRTVAIKTINLKAAPELMGTPEDQARRFANEARTIADLEHPYILPIYTFGQDDDWLYIVMRYMPGGTLRKLIQREPIDVARAIELAAPLADALDLAHVRKVVHRDIKSVNILLDAQNRPYLADFGLSVTAGDASAQSGSGTLAYMSPEVIRGKPGDDRSDLYSFGIMLVEMLTGDTPTAGGQHWNLSQATGDEPLPLPDSLALGVGDVLRRATALDPADRYASASAIVEALKATIEPERSLDMLTLDDDGFLQLLPTTDPAQLALNKANDLFMTALEAWADGAGRFRLYADDFKYIDSFYSAGESWDLTLDDAGKRMMLRAAIEHGYKLEAWSKQVSAVAEQRAVALQALTSELPHARLRAIERLTAIDDSTPPAIPVRVASIIAKDPDAEVRRAGVALLDARAKSVTAWQPVVFDTFIDGTLAELAAHDADRGVAEAAARTIGRRRSHYAVDQLGGWAAGGGPGALRALINIRDEVPALPTSVPASIRQWVFLALSRRQFFTRELLTRYVSAAIAAAIGIGVFVFWRYRETASSASILVDNLPLTNGVEFGLGNAPIVALMLVLAIEPAALLRAWSRGSRIALSIVLGGLLATIFFLIYRVTFYNNGETPDWFWIVGPSFLFTVGFAISSGLTRSPLIRALSGGAGIVAGLYVSWAAYLAEITLDPLLTLDESSIAHSIGFCLWLAVTLGFITFLPEWIGLIRSRTQRTAL